MVNVAFGSAVSAEIATVNPPPIPDPVHHNFRQRARQGDPEAVAAWLNAEFKPHGMTFKTVWKGTYLTVLAEAKALPEAHSLLFQVQTKLEQLPLESTQTIHFYGRVRGEQKPEWGYKLHLSPPQATKAPKSSPGHRKNSLADWLLQGNVLSSPLPFQESSAATEEQRFLRCRLGSQDTILIPLTDIQSVFKTHLAAIVPVPDMPEVVLGVHNYRGEMLWMVDLKAQLGLEPCTAVGQEQDLIAIAIAHQNTVVGFVAQAEIEVESQPVEHWRDLHEALFPAEMVPYLAGYSQTSGFPILKVSALVNGC